MENFTAKIATNKKVLVVDDSFDATLLLSEILGMAGYDVTISVTGQEALDSVSSDPPSIILLDIMMPELDGFEVCQRLKLDESTSNIPVIFISALGDEVSILNGFKAGAVDYITKPINSDEVLARVNTHLKLSSLQQELIEKNEALELEISKSRKQKEELEKSINLFQGLFNASPDAIILIDPHERSVSWPIIDCNKAACDMNGFTRDEMVGKSIDILNAENQSQQDHDNYFQNLQDKRSIFIETYHKHKGGHVFPIEVLTTIINIAGKEYILGIDRDITEKKKAEEELRIFKMGINNAADGFIVTDKDGSIKFVNPSFTRIYGYSFDEAIGKTPRILKSGFLTEEDYKEFWDTLLSKTVVNSEIINKRKDGSLVNIEESINPIVNDNYEIVGFLSVHRDITEKKKAEVELITAKYKAEESDRLKSAFLANMSHEIRTPLNCILGFSEMLSDPEVDADQRKEFSQLIETSANNLLTIINDIIDISKIESGQVELNMTTLSVQKLLRNVCKEFEPKATEKQLVLKIASEMPEGELFIHSDEGKLKQVLINFVGNAIKFTEKGSITIGVKETKGQLHFYVEDTGIGIEEKFQGQVFERFRQAETAHTRKYGGNGLGLAISKELIEMLGGTIGFDSKPGIGSTFYFNIPVS